MDAIRTEIIHKAARDRFAAPHGEQGQIIERAARTLGLSVPRTPSDTYRKAIAAQAYATPQGPATIEQSDAAIKRKQAPYVGQFDPLADLKAAKVPAYLSKVGVAHAAAAPTVEAARLSVAEACQRIKLALRDDYDINTYVWLTERHGNAGVPEDAVQALIAQHREAAAATVPQVGLRAVGGGV